MFMHSTPQSIDIRQIHLVVVLKVLEALHAIARQELLFGKRPRNPLSSAKSTESHYSHSTINRPHESNAQ